MSIRRDVPFDPEREKVNGHVDARKEGRKRIEGGMQASYLVVGNDLNFSVLENTYATICGAQVNANHSAKRLILCANTRRGCNEVRS